MSKQAARASNETSLCSFRACRRRSHRSRQGSLKLHPYAAESFIRHLPNTISTNICFCALSTPYPYLSLQSQSCWKASEIQDLLRGFFCRLMGVRDAGSREWDVCACFGLLSVKRTGFQRRLQDSWCCSAAEPCNNFTWKGDCRTKETDGLELNLDFSWFLYHPRSGKQIHKQLMHSLTNFIQVW